MIREEGGGISVSGIFVSVEENYTIDIEAPRSVNLKLRGEDDDISFRVTEGGGDFGVVDT